jgi:hypothetical protein
MATPKEFGSPEKVSRGPRKFFAVGIAMVKSFLLGDLLTRCRPDSAAGSCRVVQEPALCRPQIALNPRFGL